MAVSLHGRAKLDEAEQHYRAVLGLEPGHVATLHRLALLLAQSARFAEAAEVYEKLLAAAPQDAEAHANFGQVLLLLGRYEEALAQLRASVDLKPESAETHTILGNALAKLNCPEEALASYAKSLSLNPKLPEPHNNRGNVLLSLGRLDEAVVEFKRALALKSDFVTARSNLASALVRLEQPQEAITEFERVLAQRPDLASAHFNLGNALAELERHEEAVLHFSKAITLQPQFASAYNNVGNSLDQLGRSGEALAAYEKALAVDPGLALAYFGRGGIMRRVGRFEESLADYEKAAALAPDLVEAANLRFNLAALLCDWRGRVAGIGDLRRHCLEGRSVSPFELLWVLDEPDINLLAAKSKAGSSKHARCEQGHPAHNRLRIAYVSADYCEHPVAHHAVELFEHHDKSRFETYGISLKTDASSPIRERLRRAFDHFEETGSRTNSEIAQMLAELEIDIAVDLNGHTSFNRLKAFAFRPAPVSVTYLGYPGSTGADYIDYILADPYVVPPDSEPFYSEKTVRLPDCFMPRDTTGGATILPLSRAEAGLPETGFVFSAFNQSGKLNPAMFDIWMRLLRGIDGSVLWLNVENPTARKNLRDEASARGVSSDRLVFAERVPSRNVYFARLACADLFLDTHPYGAHATASDFLWAGVPVVTAPGRSFASRVAGSMLKVLNLNELIADGFGQYEQKAMELARSPEKLAAIRMKLAEARKDSALFDMRRLCRNLESAYRTMWELHMSGRSPQSFSVISSDEPVR